MVHRISNNAALSSWSKHDKKSFNKKVIAEKLLGLALR